jgi:hypothetical protein
VLGKEALVFLGEHHAVVGNQIRREEAELLEVPDRR